MLFNVRLFNSLRQEWARKRLDFDPLWAAGLCLDFDQRRDLPGEILDAVSWTVETGRIATHRLVTLEGLRGAQMRDLIGRVAERTTAEGDRSIAAIKERAYAELDRLGAAELAATWYGPAA